MQEVIDDWHVYDFTLNGQKAIKWNCVLLSIGWNNMIKTTARFWAFLIGLLYQMAIRRLLAPKSIFSSLAITSLMISGAAFTTPLWQQLIEMVISQCQQGDPFPPYMVGVIFLFLTFLFAWLSHRLAPKLNPEKLVDTKVISPPISLSNSRVYCYCGTVLTMSEAEVVVTSENTELNLGSFRGVIGNVIMTPIGN